MRCMFFKTDIDIIFATNLSLPHFVIKMQDIIHDTEGEGKSLLLLMCTCSTQHLTDLPWPFPK